MVVTVPEPSWPQETASASKSNLSFAVVRGQSSDQIHALLVPADKRFGGRVGAALAGLEGVRHDILTPEDLASISRVARKFDSDVTLLAIGRSREKFQPLIHALLHDPLLPPLIVITAKTDDSLALKLLRSGVGDCIDLACLGGDDGAVALRRVVQRHRRTLEQHERKAQRTVGAAASDVLDRLPLGVMMLDDSGHVLMTNAAARSIVAKGDGLRADPATGTFQAERPEETKALLELVKRTIKGDIGADESCALTISRSSMKQPLCVMVTPLTARGRDSKGRRTGAAIFMSDPEDRIEIEEDALRGLYGLTRVESNLALGLVRGKQLDELAVESRISVHTVRSQLKQIFRKTDTNRQADLVKLLLTGPAAVRVRAIS